MEKHLKGRRLSFEDKRQLAKMLCTGRPRKVIAEEMNVSLAALCEIMRNFVVVTLTERYPDPDPQLDLFNDQG